MASGIGSSDINLMVAFSQKLEVHIGFSGKAGGDRIRQDELLSIHAPLQE